LKIAARNATDGVEVMAFKKQNPMYVNPATTTHRTGAMNANVTQPTALVQ
jgi:hypothetical protein